MKIKYKAIIEVVGKPKEHIETAIKGYVENLKNSEDYQVISVDYADAEQQQDQSFWSIFAELELETDDLEKLHDFCFEYMPSTIEITEPKEFVISDGDMSLMLTKLQSKLHSVDMVAKQVKIENDRLKKNTGSLLQNYILIILAKGDHTSEKLSKFTGVPKEQLEDFLDKLIDANKIKMKNGIYSIKNE
jgi:hypothetical protein